MYIYHYTHWKDLQSIVDLGLTYKMRDDYNGTQEINYVLDKHRPKHLKPFIDRNKCIFFYPRNKYQCGIGDCAYRVNIKNLDLSRLYVADFEPAQTIWGDVVDAPYSGEYSGIPLETSALEYWNSLRLFTEYCHEKEPKRVEVLYFGEIPFEFIEACCFISPVAQKMYSILSKDFDIVTWSSFDRFFQLKDEKYFLHFHPTKSELTIGTNDGSCDSDFVKYIENLIDFKDKDVSYSYNIKITYHEISIK